MTDREGGGLRNIFAIFHIVLILFATILMALSIWQADTLPVIGNGLLLGGVFTMVGGVGINITSNESVTRFVVLVSALAVTLVLGWWRFVRRSAAPRAVTGQGIHAPSESLAALEGRLEALERRVSSAAALLAAKE